MRLFLAAILLLPAQSEADKLEAALKTFGDRTFGMYVSGKKAGKLTLKTRIETEDGRRIAVFEDSTIEPATGGKVTSTVTEKASLDKLRVSSLRWVTLADGRKNIDSISVEGNKATVRSEGGRKTLDVPDGTMGESGLLRRVCAAEQTKGASFTFDILSHATQDVESRELKCDGDVEIEIAGKKQPCFRWSEKTQEGKPGAQVKNTYWVSPAGHLLKFIGLGGVEYVLESK